MRKHFIIFPPKDFAPCKYPELWERVKTLTIYHRFWILPISIILRTCRNTNHLSQVLDPANILNYENVSKHLPFWILPISHSMKTCHNRSIHQRFRILTISLSERSHHKSYHPAQILHPDNTSKCEKASEHFPSVIDSASSQYPLSVRTRHNSYQSSQILHPHTINNSENISKLFPRVKVYKFYIRYGHEGTCKGVNWPWQITINVLSLEIIS